MRVEGNLASLAAMVRSNTRKGEAQVAPAPGTSSSSPAASLPESTRTIAGGLSREETDPLRDEGAIAGLVSGMAESLRNDPGQALAAQGLIHPDRVRTLG